MSRSARLFDLLQALRRRRRPVTAAVLAAELGVSERTIYRDIATLVGQGAAVEGEAGLGYILRPGFMLPPLMFGDDEIEALVLGLRLVAQRADAPLTTAAADVLAKITAVLPPALRDKAENAALIAGATRAPQVTTDVAMLRRTIRAECKLRISYADAEGKGTERTIWPIAIAFFDKAQVVAAWCETRQDFRHFRTDRILLAQPTEERYPRRRTALVSEWRKRESIPEQI